MYRTWLPTLALWLLLGAALPAAPATAVDLEVVSTEPEAHTSVNAGATVVVHFDRPVQMSSVVDTTFRVFGNWSGPAPGAFQFLDGNQSVRFLPDDPFSAGEIVTVFLSHEIEAADGDSLRSAGYTFQFMIRAAAASMEFTQIDSFTNRINDVQTRIYGAAACDYNNDGWVDLGTINEISGDVRMALNRADGSGLFEEFLPPQLIGFTTSPSECADLDNDGIADIVVAAADEFDVWVLLGSGDGTFHTITPLTAGSGPHGVAVLDADGDGDTDIVNTNLFQNNMSTFLNDGTGSFGAAQFWEAGVVWEDGLASGDMNRDGILDLVVSGRQSEQVIVWLGNGDGTFSPGGDAMPSGGETWVVNVGDLDGDRNLDVATSNNFDLNGGVLLGNGDGTLDSVVTYPIPGRGTSSDLADLDGDGDLDWVLSSFTGFWSVFENDGNANFSLHEQIPGPSNPSCSVLFDIDNDLDVDLVLTDEIADVILIMQNGASTVSTKDRAPNRPVQLLPPVPNPSSDATAIRFRLPQAGPVLLRVVDAAGRTVRTLSRETYEAGDHTVTWDGRSDTGIAPAGMYFIQLQFSGDQTVRKAVRVR